VQAVLAVGSVSEPEYVHRRPADSPGRFEAADESGWPPAKRSPRPRLGKETGEDEDVVYGQVRYVCGQGRINEYICSLPLWRVHEIKCMYLASRTHGLFIT
jgi:hypothetical protein